MKSVHSIDRKNKDRGGAAIVEMAVCFPVFMLMLLGIVEFGRALMVSQLLTNAAREACREAVIDGASNAEVQETIDEIVTNTVGCATTDITTTFLVTDVDSGATSTSLSDAEQRDLIEIDIVVPFSAISFTSGKFLTGQSLRGQCAMRRE